MTLLSKSLIKNLVWITKSLLVQIRDGMKLLTTLCMTHNEYSLHSLSSQP